MGDTTQTSAPPPAAPPARRLADLGIKKSFSRAEILEAGGSIAKAPGMTLEDYFQANAAAIVPLLPREMRPDRLLKLVVNAVRRKPRLRECTKASLFGAAILCAQMGLEPDTHAGHCYLIPRSKRSPRKDSSGQIMLDGNRKQIWDEVWSVEVQLATKGKIELAYRSPHVQMLKAVAAYEGDPDLIISEGTEQTLIHHVDPRGNRGEIVGFYAIAKIKDCDTLLYEWVPRSDVEYIRDTYSDAYASATAAASVARHKLEQAQTPKDKEAAERALARANDTPWITNFSEMGRGLAIRRLYKYLPTSPEMEMAGELEDRSQDGGQDLEGILTGEGPMIDQQPEHEPDLDRGETEGQPDGEDKDKSTEGQQQDKKAEDKPPGPFEGQAAITHEQTIPQTLDVVFSRGGGFVAAEPVTVSAGPQQDGASLAAEVTQAEDKTLPAEDAKPKPAVDENLPPWVTEEDPATRSAPAPRSEDVKPAEEISQKPQTSAPLGDDSPQKEITLPATPPAEQAPAPPAAPTPATPPPADPDDGFGNLE